MQKQWLCVRMCHTHLMLDLQEKNGNIIKFAQLEERNLLSETKHLLSETRDDAEKINKYDDSSTIPSLTSVEEMDAMFSGDESDTELLSKHILEDICDGSQSHTIINRREAR